MSPDEIAWTRAEIAHAEQAGIDRALDVLRSMASTADRDAAEEPMQEYARRIALAELSLAHGHAVALEAQLVMAGAA